VENRTELISIVQAARGQLEHLQLAGVSELAPLPKEEDLPSCSLTDGSTAEGGPCRRESLEEVLADLGDCQRCGLSGERQKIVFGVGNPEARLVLVGEAPGREEDLRGEPFVGEAGRLLDRILLAMGLKRADVYICNVQKCRPPSNRDPQEDEIAACEPFLQRQLAAIGPDVILTLGRFAAQTLLRDNAPIGRLRGAWRDYQGIPLMPTFHPAYILRTPAAKREVWEDVKQVMVRLRG